jgi:WD40 repeat protein
MNRPAPPDAGQDVRHKREIDRVCDRFEEAWQSGSPPPLEECLAGHSDLDGAALFRELLHVEWGYRSRRARVELVQDLLRRFPQHAEVVRGVTREAPDLPATTPPTAQAGSRAGGSTVVDGPSPEPAPRLPAGYEPMGVLGRGGMGVVYRVRNRRLNRIEALKVIRPDWLEGLDPNDRRDVIERFEDEARTAGRLDHSNIVRVFEVGRLDGVPYYSMQLVPGASLADLLHAGPLPGKKAAECLRSAAEAVAHAHGREVIHRDLKPSNVLIDEQGQAYVVDFGLAKCVAGTDHQTRTNALVGTLPYMAPEQAKDASRVTPASDVYGLGATLYHAVTGRPPFQGASPTETLEQLLHQEPVPPRQLNAAIDRDLETIVLRCLQKEPGRRYAAAQDLADDLGRYGNGEPIHARPVGAPERLWLWCRRQPVVASLLATAFAALLALVGALWYGYAQKSAALEMTQREADAERARAEAERARAEERRVGLVRMANLHAAGLDRDGSLLALLYHARALELDPASGTLSRLRLGTALQQCPRPAQVLFHPGEVIDHAEPSPDGRTLVAAGWGNAAHLWDVSSGRRLATLRHQAPVTRACFSPDGKRVATASDDETARVWDAATGQALTAPLDLGVPVIHVAFSPDGARLLTAGGERHIAFRDEGFVWQVDHILIPGKPIRLPNGQTIPGAMQKQVILKKGPPILLPPRGLARVWDATTGEPVGEVMRLAGWINHASFSPDGGKVATAAGRIGQSPGARVWDAATGKPLTEPLEHPGDVYCAAFSPDGKRLLTACGRPDDEGGEARLWDADTGQPVGRPLTHGRQVVHAEFSPDGGRVLTASWDRTVRVWDATTGEGGVSLRLNDRAAHAAFSPDGRAIVTTAADHEVRVWDAATGDPLTPALPHGSPVTSTTFGSEGRRVVTSCWDGTVRVWDLTPAQPRLRSFPQEERVSFVAFGKGEGRLLVARGEPLTLLASTGSRSWSERRLEPRSLVLLDAETGKPAGPVLRHTRPVSEASQSPDGGRLVVVAAPKGGEQHEAQLWDVAEGKAVGEPFRSKEPIRLAYFTADGCRAVTGEGGSVRVWNVVTGEAVTPELRHDHPGQPVLAGLSGGVGPLLFAFGRQQSRASVSFLASSPDGRRLFTACQDGTGRVWDATDDGLVSGPFACPGPVTDAAFSADGRRLLWVTRTAPLAHDVRGEVRLWDVEAGRALGVPLVHQGRVSHAAFSPDGTRVATAGADQAARVWDTATGRPVTPPLRHHGEVSRVIFSDDGRLLATAGHDQAARVWDAATGEPLTAPLRHDEPVTSLAFGAGGRELVTGTARLTAREKDAPGGSVRVWRLTPDEGSPEDVRLLAEVLTGHRLDEAGGAVPLEPAALAERWKRLSSP